VPVFPDKAKTFCSAFCTNCAVPSPKNT